MLVAADVVNNASSIGNGLPDSTASSSFTDHKVIRRNDAAVGGIRFDADVANQGLLASGAEKRNSACRGLLR